MGSGCSWPATSRAGWAGGWTARNRSDGGAEVMLVLPLAGAERG